MTTDDLSQLSGSALRERLEEAIKENRQLKTDNQTFKARDVLSEKGFDLVEPKDLAGIEPDQFETKAGEIQAERQKQQAALLRKALEAKGFTGEDLDEMVADATQRSDAEKRDAQAIGRVRSLGTGGEVVPEVNAEKLHGYDAMRYALEHPKRKSSAA